MDDFKNLDIHDFVLNPFDKIGNEWMLITAKNNSKVNAMTAAWGGLGFMWGKNVSFIVIRPQRYTKEFIDNSDKFSLCFFDEKYKKTLSYFGTVSGRDEDKIAKSNLTLVDFDNVPIFEEANLVLVCKKLYRQTILPNCFIDTSLDEKWYPIKDYHDLYVSEIEQILTK